MSTILEQSKRFSWLLEPSANQQKPQYDHVVFSTKTFVAIPSLGSLVDGWLLVVPKRRVPNFASLYKEEWDELTDMLEALKRRMSAFDGTPQIFEHGGLPGSSLSCGVEQAHLHLVPLNFDLAELCRDQENIMWNELENHRDIVKLPDRSEYLFVQSTKTALHGRIEKPFSQFFRKLIASQLGLHDCWNYRTHPFEGRILNTLLKFGA